MFNLLVGFVYLFIIAFILINPNSEKTRRSKKSRIYGSYRMAKFNDDIDLWVKSPDGKTVSFVKKENGIMNLEKDDLGVANDSTVDEYGQRKVIYINREVITIRGILAGQYQVAHMYIQ